LLGTKRPAVVSALVVAIAAYCVWWFFWSGDGFHRHSTNADNRAAVMRLHAALRVGDDFEKVLNEYWSQRTEELRLHVEARDQWFVSMPGEFGASDWTLVVKYHDGKVSAIRVRTADGPGPTDGPADKGSPDA
jgi:hypothetical protein